jgi:hypothetical protein
MAGQPKAAIFDHSTLLGQTPAVTAGLREVQNNLHALGVKTVVFSTHPIPNFAGRIAACGYPAVDLLLTRADVGVNKGSPQWVTEAAGRLGIPVHRFFYLGDDERDWRTAINSGILYLHAGWTGPLPAGVTAFLSPNTGFLWRFLTHFFLPPPRWQYTLDDPARRLCVRGLLNATVRLAADPPHGTFSLQDIFTYENARQVGGVNARDLLMMHAIANLCAEGLICSGCRFAVYPSSTPGNPNPTFTEFLGPASRFFHGWLRENMMHRAAQAIDSSMARHHRQPVTFSNQTNTLHVHPDYNGSVHLVGKRIIVFDDFTTSGMSLEWARILLSAAGADRVVLVTFGKYGRNHPLYHSFYQPPARRPVQPFQLNNYADHEFACTQLPMTCDDAGRQVTQTMFERWRQEQPYPVTTL